MKLLLLFIFVLNYVKANDSTATLTQSIYSNHAHITVVGAYGDLAKKYLWKGVFNLYQQYSVSVDNTWVMDVYGAGQKNLSRGEKLLNNAVTDALSCIPEDELCVQRKALFINNLRYLQLREEQDYINHCAVLTSSLTQNHCYDGHPCQYQRIFYLSVPPFAYKTISKYLASHCRPPRGTGLLKVVFEKPFGHNQASAVDQAEVISQYLEDDEVYRVDHYLGKKTVREIIYFRQENHAVNRMLNRKSVERIEIVMKEIVSAKGRTSFYDKYGVLNDVMQNHLSEIMYLITMDLPSLLDHATLAQAIDENKVKLLQQINTISENNVVLGQYQGYLEEVREETGDLNATSTTPTFAAVKLSVASPRWEGVPIVMVAGKKLDERTGYARIVFKESHFSVNKNRKGCLNKDLIFHIGHGTLRTAAILVSRSLPLTQTYSPTGWKITNTLDHTLYLNLDLSCYYVFVPIEEEGAYDFLIKRLFHGQQEHFLSLSGLLDSWRVWGEVVDNIKVPLTIYSGGNATGEQLNFIYDADSVYFQERKSPATLQAANWQGKFIIEGSEPDVTVSLAEDIRLAALDAVKERKTFHIAFSGGNSPLPLFRYLSTFMRTTIPWGSVHIWQVDERCTSDLSQLNFNAMKAALLNNIPYLLYKNIHPMPSSTCDDENAYLYESTLTSTITEPTRLDYIVLGAGKDGHTASLFPEHELLNEKKRLVAVAKNVPHQINKRMTLTFPAINSARKVALIVSGKHKCEMIRSVKQTNCDDVALYPVCGLAPSNGSLTWFVSACEGNYVF